MPLIRKSEEKYVLSDKIHSDGSRTIELRYNTPFSVKKRIVNRMNKENLHATLYSDNRIESSYSGTASMEKMK